MSDLSDVQFLSIKSYSDHPEVYKMADLIVDSYVASKKRVHRKKYVLAARKLVASLWCHPSDWFRFSTKPAYYSTEKKQVFLTNKILTLFKHMRSMEPELFRLVYKAIPPGISNTGRGVAAVYCRADELFADVRAGIDIYAVSIFPVMHPSMGFPIFYGRLQIHTPIVIFGSPHSHERRLHLNPERALLGASSLNPSVLNLTTVHAHLHASCNQ